jgi:hypothetical protein
MKKFFGPFQSILGRLFLTLLIFTLLVALFYFEEDWRGRHSWQTYKQQIETKGENLDFASIIPPQVPDEQNFAMTPVVASSYAAMLDGSGHEVNPRKTNITNRMQMKIYAKLDELDIKLKHYPEFDSWQKEAMTDLKLWQEYYRLKAAESNEFPIPPQPQSPARDVLLALGKYDSTIEELRRASRLPYSRFPLNYEEKKQNPAAILLPHLAALKTCAQTLALRATAELQDNQSEKAFEDAMLALQLAGKIRTEPFLISSLVRIAMLKLALQPVWEGLAENRWSEAQLVSLDEELGKLDFLADYDFAMREERCFDMQVIEHLRHADNPPREFDSMMMDDGKTLMRFEVIALLLGPSGWYDQNKVQIAGFFQKWYLRAADHENRTFLPTVI